MKTKIKIMLVVSSVLLTPILSSAAEMRMKASHGYAAGKYMMNVYHEYWKEAVERYTDGRVKVTIFPMAQLFPASEEVKALSMGSIDFATPPGIYLAPSFPPVRLFEAPFLFADTPHRARFFKSVKEQLTAMYLQKGIKYLGETEWAWYTVWNNKRPITKMEDWQGLKIRCGSTQQASIHAWGGSGILLPSAEANTAIQQGMVDGLVFTADYIVSNKLEKYLKHGTTAYKYIYQGSCPQLMSMKTWNNLPADIQQIIENKVAPEVWDRSIQWVGQVTDNNYKVLQNAGVQLDWFKTGEVEKMVAKFQPELSKLVDEWGPVAKELYQIVQKTR